MKNTTIKLLVAGAAAACLSTMTVQAIPITGSVAFSGGVAVNNFTLGSATAITSFNGEAVTGSRSGSYAGVTTGTTATFAPFTFQPNGSLPPNPLWTFSFGGLTYQFQATTESASFDSVHSAWNIGGAGLANITGFTQTSGTWSLTITQQGDSLSFASAAAAVPDGGTTVLLLGSALSVLGLIKRFVA